MEYPKFAVAISNEEKRAYFFNYRSKISKQDLFVMYLTNNIDEAIKFTREINERLDKELNIEHNPNISFII